MEKIICPICGSDKNKFFCEKNNYKIYFCFRCRAGFVWPVPETSKDLYSESYFINDDKVSEFGYTDYEKDKESMKGIFVSYLKKIEQITKGRKLIDIGAATGYFLDLAKERNWETFGIELSEYAASRAGEKGHKMIDGRLIGENINEKFSAVTMWDVLEHFNDPKNEIRKAGRLLEAGGVLLLNTIDFGSLSSRLMGRRWHLIVPPEHLFYFSRKSLFLLLESSGFKIIAVEKMGKKFSFAYIFKVLYNWQKLIIWKKLSNYFNNNNFSRKFYIPINLRDNILIIAKKNKDA